MGAEGQEGKINNFSSSRRRQGRCNVRAALFREGAVIVQRIVRVQATGTPSAVLLREVPYRKVRYSCRDIATDSCQKVGSDAIPLHTISSLLCSGLLTKHWLARG
jgi:hypothetical protein